ncbi:MAG TPA: PadR family transcriptional regulator [Thermoleophilaceae bacterium]|nr:PadR family transcriptional regulator [Thermoleophilaceae bacterium]
MKDEYARHGRCAHRGPGRRARHGYGRRYGSGGPRARRGDVRAAALALLVERPMHGYEMIKEIEERTQGLWRPSAGSIYPTLALLEDEGLIRGEESEGKRRFALTDDGREQAEGRKGTLPWEQVTAGADPGEIRLREAFFALRAAVLQVGGAGSEEQAARARDLLDETRKRIYAILAEDA